MKKILRREFRLGDKRISPLEGQILGRDGPQHIPPKVMDVLLCLVERPGEVVIREDIIAQVWGNAELGGRALTRSITDLRNCLGDNSDHPKFIRTIPKRGYQLIAEVDFSDLPDNESAAEPRILHQSSAILTLIESLRRRRVFRAVGAYAIFAWLILQILDVVNQPLGFPPWTMTTIIWIVIVGFPITVAAAWTLQITDNGIVVESDIGEWKDRAEVLKLRTFDYVIVGALALILSLLTYQLMTKSDQPVFIETDAGQIVLPEISSGLIEPNSIAVLPFLNIGVETDLEYLALGLAEEVLNLLANVSELKVVSRQASFRYRDSDVDMQTITNELRVRNILEGSVQGDGGDLRITAQLIDTDSGFHIWSQTYKHDSSDILRVRDEIAHAVVDSLKVVLSVESQTRLAKAPTKSAAAYDYYLQALSYLRRPKTEQTLDNAQGLFRRALDLDPEYVKAHAGICEVFLAKYRLHRETQYVGPAENACKLALELDSNLPEVHSALGTLYRLSGRTAEAELAFQRAIVLKPRLEPAYYGLGRVYMTQDRLEEAETIFQYAVGLEPGYWGTHLALGNFYLEFGRPTDAIAPFRRVTELNPNYTMGFNNLGAAYYNSGDLEGGEQAFLMSLEIGLSEQALSNLGTMYYNSGRFEKAADMYRQAIEVTPHDYTTWGRLAAANRFVPEREMDVVPSYRTAIELAEDDLHVNPDDSRTLAYIASYYANVGEAENARSAIDRALRFGPNDPHVRYFLAHVEVLLGTHESALTALEQAAELGYSIDAIANDPDFIPLRTDRRFRAIVN